MLFFIPVFALWMIFKIKVDNVAAFIIIANIDTNPNFSV